MKPLLCKLRNAVAYLVLLIVLPAGSLFGQAWNVTLLSNWDDNTLPVFSGLSYNEIWGYAANGREYAIIGTLAGTYFIDVTLANSPVVVKFEPGGHNNCIWRDYKTYGTYCYAVADAGTASTLQVFDLSGLPATVTKVFDSNVFFRRAHNIFIDQGSGRLYAAGANTNMNGITVLDIQTNPAAPTLLTHANLGKYSHDIYVRNDTVFCFMGTSNGFEIWDFTNLGAISNIGIHSSYPEQGYCHQGYCTTDRNYLFHVDETSNTGIKVTDVSNPGSPNTVHVFRSALLAPTHTNTMPHNVYIRGDTLYVSYYEEGVQIYDISNPVAPVKIAYYDTHPANTTYNGFYGCWGVYPYLPSGTILGSDDLNGLFVFAFTSSLPVQFGPLTATPDAAGGLQLDWSTEVENGNSHFVVERSGDGSAFEALAEIPARGNSMHKQEYSAKDADPLAGDAWYRVRQVDFDGKSSYSETVHVNAQASFSITQVFPNPVENGEDIQIAVQMYEAGRVETEIRDLSGKTVFLETYDLAAGNHPLVLQPGALPAGLYLLRCSSATTRVVQKLLLR